MNTLNREKLAKLMNKGSVEFAGFFACPCVSVCVPEADQLTFEYLAEHSLT